MTAHTTNHSPICVYIDAIELWIIYSTILIYIASVDSLSLAFVASAYAAAPTLLPREYLTKKHGTTTSSLLLHNMYAMRKADMLQSKFRGPLSKLSPCCIQGNTGSGDIIERLGADAPIRSSKDCRPDSATNGCATDRECC